jgi:ribonuclease HI
MATEDDICHARIGACRTDDALILQEYKEAITVKAWEDAASRYDGKGLHKGVPSTRAANNILTAFKKEEAWDEARALQSCLFGTVWTADRKIPGGSCYRCGAELEDTWHRYWDCPCNGEVPDPNRYIDRSNPLTKRIRQTQSPCLWGRAMLPADLLYLDAPAAKDREQDGEWQTVAHQAWVVAYTDGEGFDHKASPVCQRVGAGAVVCSIDIEQGKWGEQQVKVRTKVKGKQTVPRAELTAMIEPLEGLASCQAKCNVLVVLDAEHVFNTAKDDHLLSAALQSCNADLWKRWQDFIVSFPGTLVLLHVRSHALDGRPDSEVRRQQNITRRRYAVPAGRADLSAQDAHARAVWTEKHWPEVHMQGNALADKEASQAQSNSLPPGMFQEEAERWQANAGLVARRIATIEAHIRNTRIVAQADLKEVMPVPKWVDVLGVVERALSNKGHNIQERNGWFECQKCFVRRRKHKVDYFWKQQCHSRPSPELVEMWPGGLSVHTSPTLDAEDRNTGILTQTGAKESTRKRRAEEIEDTGEVRDSMDGFARMVKARMQERRHERLERDHAIQSENAAPREEPSTAGSWSTNPLDEPECEADENLTEEGMAEINPLDNPEGEMEEEVADQVVAEEVAKRKMPQHVRNRIIKLRAKERVARNRAEIDMQKQAVRWRAFRTVEAAPSKGISGLGEGHTCFALGPIIFCKVCGGTRSSSGILLKRACRGWGPPGTMCNVKALLKGRPCSGFYRKLLLKQCTPLRRLSCKTKPVVRCQVPRHLVQDDDSSSDEVCQAPRPALTRRTVYLGAAWGA